MKLKVLSWNIWVDCHFDRLRDFIVATDADIVALQEVRADDPERDVIELMKSLGYNSALGLKQHWTARDFYFGPATFTKGEILSSDVHELSQQHMRYAVSADIKFGNKVLHTFNVHLKHDHQKPSDIQMEQSQTLLSLLPESRTIVAGDFNATPNSATIRSVNAVLDNTDPSNAPTWSMYPEGCPECNPQSVDTRLDYIFATKDLHTSNPQVGKSAASDHLPISITVEL